MSGFAERVASEVVQNWHDWSNRWAGWRTRVAQVRALVESDWSRVFPEQDMDLPLVANLFRDTVEDGGRLFAEQLPNERVPPAGPRDASRAERMEQALVAYTQSSGIFNMPEAFGMDLIAAGIAVVKVWPVSEPIPLPRFRRIDPEYVLVDPLWRPEEPTERVILHYPELVERLRRSYPEQVDRLLERVRRMGAERARVLPELAKGFPAEITVVEAYTRSYIARVAVCETAYGPEGELLSYMENTTRLCPVQVAARPTWSREPRGQLDDAKGPARMMNRYSRLLFDYFTEMVYGGKLAWNVKNPTERGPGTVYFALSPDARLEPITPNIPSVQVYEIIDRLEAATRTSANNPRSREGDVQLNKATAAFLEKATGKLASSVRSLQRAFAVAKRYANEVAFAQDETWCDRRKTVTGLARGRRYQLSYRPSELIRGDRANIVSYGTSSGLDTATHQVLWLERRQSRSVSLETYLENDPAIEDVPQEIAKLRAEQLAEAVMAGLMQPDTPLEDRLVAWRAFREGREMDAVVEAIMRRREQQQAALPALPEVGQMMQPSGIPGAPVPQRPPALPPLEMLRRG